MDVCDIGLIVSVIILAVSADKLKYRIEQLEENNKHLEKRIDNLAELCRMLSKK